MIIIIIHTPRSKNVKKLFANRGQVLPADATNTVLSEYIYVRSRLSDYRSKRPGTIETMPTIIARDRLSLSSVDIVRRRIIVSIGEKTDARTTQE